MVLPKTVYLFYLPVCRTIKNRHDIRTGTLHGRLTGSNSLFYLANNSFLLLKWVQECGSCSRMFDGIKQVTNRVLLLRLKCNVAATQCAFR